ncbi:MAG: hypothetical protein RR536_01895 [Anaerovoracaceae bacterium]
MKTQIIYDNEGVIISNISSTGSIRVPVGLPYLVITDLKSNQYVEKVDVSANPHQPVIKEYPKSETERLLEEHDVALALLMAEV